MSVLVVQNIRCETLGLLEELFRSDGFTVEAIDGPSDHVPVDPEPYSAIVILGGPVSVYDGLAYLEREQNLIRKAIKAGTPVLGICLGSQLIAQAAGGRVYKGSAKEIGWHPVMVTPAGAADVFRGISPTEPIQVFQWHGDTCDLPHDAVLLAKNELYPQAFRIGSAIGIQFHLEVDEEMIRLWSKEYQRELDSEGIDPVSILPRNNTIADLASKCSIVFGNLSSQMKLERK